MCTTMAHPCRGYTTIFLLLLCAVCISASQYENIKVENLILRMDGDKLKAGMVDPSFTTLDFQELPEGMEAPIELGVQLKHHGIDPRSVRKLSANKLVFGQHTTLELRNLDGEERCVEVAWSATQWNHTLEDCFELRPHHWFGGPEQTDQFWPIQSIVYKEYSYVTKELDSMAIAEPYWLNSAGFLIYVDPSVPLFIDQNNHRAHSFCLMARHAPPYLRKGAPELKYTMCKFADPRAAHEFVIQRFIPKPSDHPDELMVRHPIWSTWASFKYAIDDKVVLKFAQRIKDSGFTYSQLEIDDVWETCYGSLTFNKTQFPNIRGFVGQLNKMGFRTTLWVHPFINRDCQGTHSEAASKGYLVKNHLGSTVTPWWNGGVQGAGYVDFTNPAAAEWYENRLKNMLAETGIDSLKFDGGESSFSPQIPIMSSGPELEAPETIVREYAKTASHFGKMVEARVGKRTQDLAIYLRMLDRESVWGFKKNGMASIMTTTFVLNLSGYRFVMPDMVGGNGYNGDNVSKEMFIRFLQINVFLPVIQFSIPPWDYDTETIELTKKFVKLHQDYADKIIELMKETVRTGKPINMPIWWVDPTNKEAHGINSEYLLGEEILVAPVIEEGARSRDIYLPSGEWRDEVKADKPVIKGPVWLRDYPAPLDTLPYFTRVTSGAQHISISIILLAVLSLFLVAFR
ncbi:unnamed protein product [Bemisia tabaci]|uniref:Myogenesis-regulating glycosidase n=1 Tax=Bemisia tabaci TaxID=7038 RepID=A0A9P0A8X9_BEMTA|nr:unnamed protein product [Bemisia tabaci]